MQNKFNNGYFCFEKKLQFKTIESNHQVVRPNSFPNVISIKLCDFRRFLPSCLVLVVNWLIGRIYPERRLIRLRLIIQLAKVNMRRIKMKQF